MAEQRKLDDPQWSEGTRDRLVALDGAVEGIAAMYEEEGQKDDAQVARILGGLFVHGVAAVCSAISDVAMAIRDRPS